MALSNMAIFNKYVPEVAVELLAQMVEKFNGASGGSILLTSNGFEGDFFERSFFSSLESAQRRVDRYASNGSQSSTSLAQTKEASVKVAGGFGPILFEPSQMSWMMKNEAEAIDAIAKNLAMAVMKDQLNAGIASAVGAIANQSTAKNDVSGTLGLSYGALNDTDALFGDSSMNLVARIMNGAAYHKLIGLNLTNAQTLFRSDTVTIVDILGKPVIVTDAAALYEAVTPNLLKVLTLSAGGIVISDGSDVVTNAITSNGKERIETTFQADYSFGIGLKGYTWDTANGGKSPTDAELATGSNWDKVATSIKNTAGVITIGDASK